MPQATLRLLLSQCVLWVVLLDHVQIGTQLSYQKLLFSHSFFHVSCGILLIFFFPFKTLSSIGFTSGRGLSKCFLSNDSIEFERAVSHWLILIESVPGAVRGGILLDHLYDGLQDKIGSSQQ